MRVVLISHVLPAVQGLYSMLQAAGHEPVALLCTRERHERYGELEELLRQAPPDLAVVMPATRDQIAPLLRTFDPDAAFCAGFPWKIPPDALAVPKLGVVNGHPSLLPSYRGPTPVSWAIRNGETALGFTFHYMDAELDTGNVLAQAPFPLGGECSWDELSPKVVGVVGALFPSVLERLEAGDPGDPQDGQGSYFGFFEPEYVWIDWSRPALEIERQVRAWCFHSAVAGDRGALAEIGGETVRVLRVSLEPGAGTPMACGDGTMWVVETENP